MPTTFNWIYLGLSSTIIDPVEGNAISEDAALLEGTSYGTPGDPLYQQVTRATMIDNGGSATALDTNNNVTNDQFITDIGNGPETFIYDGVAVFDATLTYTDGTTATFTAIVAQDTAGHLFLAPPLNFNADIATLTAFPIESVTLGDMIANNGNLGTDRQDIGFKDGIVQGTDGDDLIDAAYIEPVEFGSDRVDNNDAPDGSNDDLIMAGDGNDTVFAGLGEDTVFGGSGDDLLYGGAGDDLLYGEDGNDTLIGGAGDDSLFGGAGDDVLYGDGPSEGRWNYEVYTQNFTSANGQAFTIENGTLALSGQQDSLEITSLGQAATGQSNPDDFGVIFTSKLFSPEGGTYRFTTTSDDGSTIRIFDEQGNPLSFSNQTGGNLPYLNNDFHQAATTRWGDVELDANTVYTIEIRFWENAGAQTLSGTVTPPGGVAEDLGSSDLVIGPDTDGGSDFLDGGTGSNLIFGGGGDDTIVVGQGDTVFGGDGDDLFMLTDSGEPGGEIVIVGGEGGETNGDTLMLTPEVSRHDITFTNTDDDNGGLSGTFTMPDGTIVTFSEIENIICFTAGTLILTEEGERPVESLRPGARVITRDHGPRTLRWVGTSRVAGTGSFAPVRVSPSLLEGARRPLLVSPQHRFVFGGYESALYFGEDEVMAAAVHLVDGVNACRMSCASVTYIHLMFDAHEVIFAEGAATESFHAGSMGLSAISPAAREDLFRAMPHLRSDFAAHGPTARRCLKAHEARLLLPAPAAARAVA